MPLIRLPLLRAPQGDQVLALPVLPQPLQDPLLLAEGDQCGPAALPFTCCVSPGLIERDLLALQPPEPAAFHQQVQGETATALPLGHPAPPVLQTGVGRFCRPGRLAFSGQGQGQGSPSLARLLAGQPEQLLQSEVEAA